jgi:ABC-2 type transport system ATP-binding protein
VISVRSISKNYGRVAAVRDVSFDVGAGEVVGLLGPNGAGKSTTIRMLTGYIRPDRGRVEIGGAVHGNGLRARWLMGYLPESAPSYPEMRVADYLHYRGRLFNMRRRERVNAIDRVCGLCWLNEVRRRRTGVLSKGFRQRVALAAALLHDPKVLILDEPSNGLDPTQIRETRDLIRELGQERTMIVSSHILPEIERTCDRILVIANGQLRADGTPDQLTAAGRGAGHVVAEISAGATVSTSLLVADPAISNTTTVRSGDGWTRLEVYPTTKCTLPEAAQRVGTIAAEHNWTVRELSTQRPSLERVFFDLVDPQPVAVPAIKPTAASDSLPVSKSAEARP